MHLSDSETADSYSRIQKLLHWSVVLLLALQYLVFDRMGGAFNAISRDEAGAYTLTSVAHIAVGTLVLLLMVWRLTLRLSRGSPKLPAAEPDWASMLARTAHWLMYALLFALPVLGLTAWFLGVPEAAAWHEIATTVLLWVVGLHLGGVLVHQLWWRTGLLRRMV